MAGLSSVDVGTSRTASQVTCGYQHTCAILDDGSVKCWGSNDAGQLGLGDTTNRGTASGQMGDSLATASQSGWGTATALSLGAGFTCAIFSGGSLRCWGSGSYGRLGTARGSNRRLLLTAAARLPRGSNWRLLPTAAAARLP